MLEQHYQNFLKLEIKENKVNSIISLIEKEYPEVKYSIKEINKLISESKLDIKDEEKTKELIQLILNYFQNGDNQNITLKVKERYNLVD